MRARHTFQPHRLVLSVLLPAALAVLSGGCDALRNAVDPAPSDAEVLELVRADLLRSIPQALVGFAIGPSIRNAQTHEVRVESRGERDSERGSFAVSVSVRMTYEIRGLIGPWVARDQSATLRYLVGKDPTNAARWVVRRLP